MNITNRNQEIWDKHFLDLCLQRAHMSKDPSTRVGSIIISPERDLLGSGYNGFPRQIKDTPERLNDRDTKLKLVIHAEMNALLSAAKLGIKVQCSTMYIAATDKSGEIWGGPPCTRCLVHVIQAGVIEIVTYKFKTIPSRWMDDLLYSKELIIEAGISYREVDL